MKSTLYLIFLSIILLSGTSEIPAKPVFTRYYKQTYGYFPSCNSCHKDGGGSSLTPYGEAYKKAGASADSFGKIGTADSDGDGATNDAEARAKSNPGDKSSTPGTPGNWLDTGSVVPRDIQNLFTGIRAWMLKDAILTPADIETGKKMGATLNAQDENTIYVPVENNFPVGTALILNVTQDNKTFYLLLTTDKSLAVKQVKVLDAKNVPAAKNDDLYKSFAGKKQDQIVVPPGRALESTIAQSVKNGLILLYVRLKGA